jgi:hypothetical protein
MPASLSRSDTLAVRTLAYDFNNDRLDLRFTGRALGASFKF